MEHLQQLLEKLHEALLNLHAAAKAILLEDG